MTLRYAHLAPDYLAEQSRILGCAPSRPRGPKTYQSPHGSRRSSQNVRPLRRRACRRKLTPPTSRCRRMETGRTSSRTRDGAPARRALSPDLAPHGRLRWFRQPALDVRPDVSEHGRRADEPNRNARKSCDPLRGLLRHSHSGPAGLVQLRQSLPGAEGQVRGSTGSGGGGRS